MRFGMVRNGLPIVSGFIVLMIGLAHFLMPSLGYAPDALRAIPEPQRDHFVFLGTYAIGTFLVAFGVLTLLSDPRRGSVFETTFFGLMVIVWVVRLVLELLYPVNLSLFFLDEPHYILLAAITIVLLGYVVGFADRASSAGRTLQ